MPEAKTPAASQEDRPPAVARLYYTGSGRRYKRASVHRGPGEALCLVSDAEQFILRARLQERQRLATLLAAAQIGRVYVAAAAADKTNPAHAAAVEYLMRLDEAIRASEP